MRKQIFFSLILTTCLALNIKAQQKNTLSNKIETYNNAFPKEKLYLSLDKSYYNVGDTLWFKSFLLNSNLNQTNLSDKIYVELFNDSSRLVERRVIALNNGLGYGDFTLDRKLTDGTYTIRAYSNWQQNFGADYFFQKSFYIGNAGEKTWLLDSYQKLTKEAATQKLDLKVRITNIKNQAEGLRDVEIYLMNDKKKIMRADLQTDINGLIETQIPLAENQVNGKYNFYIIDKKDKAKKATLPVILQDVGDIDLQFMPEGGYLVNNIYSRIAVKSIGDDGYGKNITGKIVNNKNEAISEFSANHKGMGSFYLMPKKNETYTAVYTLNGKELRSNLPLAKDEGTTLRIDHLSKPDSLYIYVKASESKRIDLPYEVIAQSDAGLELKATINLRNGFSNLKIAKKDFPDGIIHFTLFSPDQKPLNERLVFINHKQQINLQIATDKSNYGLRDSVAMEIIATKEDGKPLRGSFAVSVTDNNQVKQKTDENTINSYFLLESNLKGNIEDPNWYFSNTEAQTLLALDHLLLTQAWIGYNWEEILSPIGTLKFKAEKDNKVVGRLNGLLNTPIPNVKLTLLSLGKAVFLTDTTSNSEGKFVFNDLPIIDSPSYSIKIKKPSGKTSSAIITIDEFKAATNSLASIKTIKPWYVNADSTFMNYYKTGIKRLEQGERFNQKLQGNALKEVEIKGVRSEVISKLVWDGVLMEEFTEVQLKKVPRKSLFELLKERIPSLHIGRTFAKDCHSRTKTFKFDSVLVGNALVRAIRFDKIEGSLLFGDRQFKDWSFEAYNHLLTYFNAEDVKHIEVYKGCDGVFIDITTRSGNGPWMGRANGVYVYRPLPIYKSKDFYSPKYSIDKSLSTPDYRATIFWDANVVTDENGKAKLSFYAADLPGSYTIKVEGTDLQGRFGYQKSTINIKNKTESK